jgi:hypothetical protein
MLADNIQKEYQAEVEAQINTLSKNEQQDSAVVRLLETGS